MKVSLCSLAPKQEIKVRMAHHTLKWMSKYQITPINVALLSILNSYMPYFENNKFFLWVERCDVRQTPQLSWPCGCNQYLHDSIQSTNISWLDPVHKLFLFSTFLRSSPMKFDSNASSNILVSYVTLKDEDSEFVYYNNVLTVTSDVVTEI